MSIAVGCSGGDDEPKGGASEGDASAADNEAYENPDIDAAFVDDGGPYDPDAGCGELMLEPIEIVTEHEVEVTEVEPVALYVMLDQSQSMQVGLLWDPAKIAVAEFVDDPSSAGVDFALDYFPSFLGEAGECNGAGFNEPAVPAGRLPGHAAHVHESLDSLPLALGFGTPIEGALRGAVSYCEAFQKSHPDEKCVSVLVTDGYPEILCSADYGVITQIAADAKAKGVTTYAVGLAGADFALLDMIAQAGGAQDCSSDPLRYACDVSSGASQLVDVLKKIRDSVVTTHTTTEVEQVPLPCEWALPISDLDHYDKDLVNVELTSQASRVAFGRVRSKAHCAERGWYYDDNEAPTRVIACPESCTLIEQATDPKVDIVVGCIPMPLD